MKLAPTFKELMCQLGHFFLQSSHQNLTEYDAEFCHGGNDDDYADDDYTIQILVMLINGHYTVDKDKQGPF